jgi:hypothetical protein
MPRDGSGNYSLPLADVTPGTIITATWANTTMNDVEAAMQDSLSRSGQGGMEAPLRFVNGVAGAPGISWVNDTSTGFYLHTPLEMRASVNSADVMRWFDGKAWLWNGAVWNEVAIVGGGGAVPDGNDPDDLLLWNGSAWLPDARTDWIPDGGPPNQLLQWGGAAWGPIDRTSWIPDGDNDDDMLLWRAGAWSKESNIKDFIPDGANHNDQLYWDLAGAKWARKAQSVPDAFSTGAGQSVPSEDDILIYKSGAWSAETNPGGGTTVDPGSSTFDSLRWDGAKWISNSLFTISDTRVLLGGDTSPPLYSGISFATTSGATYFGTSTAGLAFVEFFGGVVMGAQAPDETAGLAATKSLTVQGSDVFFGASTGSISFSVPDVNNKRMGILNAGEIGLGGSSSATPGVAGTTVTITGQAAQDDPGNHFVVNNYLGEEYLKFRKDGSGNSVAFMPELITDTASSVGTNLEPVYIHEQTGRLKMLIAAPTSAVMSGKTSLDTAAATTVVKALDPVSFTSNIPDDGPEVQWSLAADDIAAIGAAAEPLVVRNGVSAPIDASRAGLTAVIIASLKDVIARVEALETP